MNIKRLGMAILWLMLLPSLASAQAAQEFGPRSLAQIEASHQGRPFLLLVWSMDCEFCQASLDNMAKLRAAHPGVAIVTVSTDPAADRALADKISARLSPLQLAEHSWSFGDEAPERLRFAIDPRWHGEKPRSYWYDAQGNRTAYSGLIRPEKLDAWRRASLR